MSYLSVKMLLGLNQPKKKTKLGNRMKSKRAEGINSLANH